MRRTIGILSLIAATTLPTLSADARPARHPSYGACYSLAIQRGWTHDRYDRRGLDNFIYRCMQGRIPF
jgi:hypothetical protein